MKSGVARIGGVGLCLALAAGAAQAEAPKNVIVFIGDGMGTEHVEAAQFYNGGLLNFQQFGYSGWMSTNNASGLITDSAASATAIATGTKVNNDVISVNPANSPLLTLLEQFKAANKSTGLVTNSTMTDATPAAFAAHTSSGSLNTATIASSYLNTVKPNVLFGGGDASFTAAAASGAGYTTVTNKTQLQALNTGATTFAAGVFGTGQFAYQYDDSTSGNTFYNVNPNLELMTQAALDVLDNNSNGFFLMVENELIDSASETDPPVNPGQRVVHEVQQLSLAVQRAINFANSHPDTLILVLGDHETGGFTAKVNNGIGVYPTVAVGSEARNATFVPVYAIGPNAGHAAKVIDNTSIFNIVTTNAPAPSAPTRITFQQGLNGYAGTHDTQLRSDQPTTAFGGNSFLLVDGDDNLSSGAQPVQSVIRFDSLFGPLGIPAGAEIRGAVLTIHTGESGSGETNDTLLLHRLLVGFTESTTWNNAGNAANNGFSLNAAGVGDDDYLATAESSFIRPQDNAMVTFDVTTTLQAWLANPDSNFGWLILSSATDGWGFDSSEGALAVLRPALEVNFAIVPEPTSAAFLLAPLLLLRRRGNKASASRSSDTD